MKEVILFILLDGNYNNRDHCLVNKDNLPNSLLTKLIYTPGIYKVDKIVKLEQSEVDLIAQAAQHGVEYPNKLIGQVYTLLDYLVTY